MTPQHPTVTAARQPEVTFPGRHLIIPAGEYPDEFAAYSAAVRLRQSAQPTVPLVSIGPGRAASVILELPDNLLLAVSAIQSLRAAGVTGNNDWAIAEREPLIERREQSRLFEEIYANLPKPRGGASHKPARLVGDMLTVARFYGLSPRLFRPLPEARRMPAMRWKQNAGPNDAVVLRTPIAAMTLDEASVEWQEIRDALIHAQALINSDKRDYAGLPTYLRPSHDLHLDAKPEVLFTYAGILLRHLLEKTGGQEPEAIAARSERPDNPDVRYDPGVRRAAMYARRVLTYALHVNRLRLLSDIGVRNPER